MQERIQNKAEIVSDVAGFLKSMDSVVFAYIFGSFARGEAFSDIDIGIYLRGNLRQSLLEVELEMEDNIQELVGYPVDVRVLNEAPVTFVFHVIKDGLLVKDEDTDFRSDFEGIVFKKTNDFIRFRNEYLLEISNAPI